MTPDAGGGKRFLITTALEDTWVADRPVTFLGDWCLLYARKDHWEAMDYNVLPYHWDDRKKFYEDYQYLDVVYEKLLPRIASRLNALHSVQHGLRYWRILVGPWLAYFVQILFDRWESIRLAEGQADCSDTHVLELNERDVVPNDMAEFIEFFQTDCWNHYIYTQVIKFRVSEPESIKSLPSKAVGSTKSSKSNKPTSWDVLRGLFVKLSESLIGEKDAFFYQTYLPRHVNIILQWKLGQAPQLVRHIKARQAVLDVRYRRCAILESSEVAGDFERFLLQMIPKQMPKIYLEGYSDFASQISGLPWPRTPKLIYTSNALWHDDVVMGYSAEKIENGSCLVYGQHGGGYGTAKFHFAEEHETKIADCYLTMGWTDKASAKIVPVGFFKYRKLKFILSSTKKILLLVTMNPPRYSFRLCSESALNIESYIRNLFSFTGALQVPIQESMTVRLTPVETGWSQPKRWLDRFPKINVDLGSKSILQLMRKSRLIVLTYNQTSILETLAFGMPTILFCNLEATPLRQTAIPFYDALKRVGIFHDTPESAAQFVNLIWNNVDSWWSNPELQNVVTEYTNKYCRRTNTLIRDIKEALDLTVCDPSFIQA